MYGINELKTILEGTIKEDEKTSIFCSTIKKY